MGGGGSCLLSEVRRESGGDMRPEIEGPDHPEEYGGGGGCVYIEVGLTTAVAAIVEAGYGRSVFMCSIFSRLMMECMPLYQKS